MDTNELISKLRVASVVINNLPERPGYNGAILQIDDTEAETIAKALEAAADTLAMFQCIGVIDANKDIYPEPPEPGTQIYIIKGDA